MTLERAIEILKANYELALKMERVNKPLAWALYYTWREVDSEPVEIKSSKKAYKI